VTRLKAPALRTGNTCIPADRVGFDIDGMVADTITISLDTGQERQEPALTNPAKKFLETMYRQLIKK
jgi:hypothetical protein